MTTPEPGALLSVQAVMRHNVRRLRELRGLTVRGLAGRLRELGSPITGSAVSKIEAGTRSISVEDWTSLSIALNCPMPALLLVPNPDDRDSWSAKTDSAGREWARHVAWVQIAEETYVNTAAIAFWMSGRTPAVGKHDWLARPGSFDEFITAADPLTRRQQDVFRHPVLSELNILEAAASEVISGRPTSADYEGGDPTIGESRSDMAAYLRNHADRLQRHIELLAEAVAEGRTPGKYLGEGGSDTTTLMDAEAANG